MHSSLLAVAAAFWTVFSEWERAATYSVDLTAANQKHEGAVNVRTSVND